MPRRAAPLTTTAESLIPEHPTLTELRTTADRLSSVQSVEVRYTNRFRGRRRSGGGHVHWRATRR